VGRRAKDTDDSEYLSEDQVQGDTDDDVELDEEHVALMVIKVPRDGGCTVACFTTILAFPYISHVFSYCRVLIVEVQKKCRREVQDQGIE
jgi:hypothetical protein